MGVILEPEAWCRQRWCREDAGEAHSVGDGCTCHPHGHAVSDEAPARLTRLTAKASRLDAFACRACGVKTRDMVESPELYFRCEACAADDRWPRLGGGRGR